MLEQVRKPLLDEARQSPALLSDLAGLERYIAESYDARSFVELLQNADDAQAGRFIIQRVGTFLLVANDGRPFTQADFESLCRSAASTKSRGTSIGYRGIGFKSVVGLAEKIHLFSGALEATFSRELTARELPDATRVPLIRIPHPLSQVDRIQFDRAIDDLKALDFTTIFVFADLIATGIEAEFSAFDESALLFLRHIRQIELRTAVETVVTVRRETIDHRLRMVRLASAGGLSTWTLLEQAGIALAFAHDEKGIKRLDERAAVAHAFLPTHETTGLAIKINGDISTDPSRTRVVLDARTKACIEQIAQLVIDVITESLDGTSAIINEQMLAALVPFSDPRMASFQRRSFKTEFLAALQQAAKGQFTDLCYRPSWLNAVDYENLTSATKVRGVLRKFENVEGLSTFLKFLGAKEATLEELSAGLEKTTPSLAGAAEVVAHVTNRHVTKQLMATDIHKEWRLWPTAGTPRSLLEVRQSPQALDRNFTDLVSEKTGTHSQLQRLVAELTDERTVATLLPTEKSIDVLSTGAPMIDLQAKPEARNQALVPPLSLKRWRSAEQQVLSLLKAQGWLVEDVSRQNVGYDIEGQTPEGAAACIEVKSIDNPGQPFTLTSNEEAVARQKSTTYYLAIVRQTHTHLEVALIQDPLSQLKLTRQCRQWVWECSLYNFDPERFPLE